jgi:hypothetical protein
MNEMCRDGNTMNVMVRTVRLVILLAMIALLPVQTLAAATAGLCMAAGHAHDHSHTADSQSPHEHNHDAPGDWDDRAPSNHASNGEDSSAHKACGPCATCCASAAISGTPSIAPAFHVATAPDSPASPQFPGVQPEQVYRPPLVG